MEEEIEILQSIYFDDFIGCDLKCNKPYIEILVYPSDSEENDDKKKLLKLNLTAYFPLNYPDQVPLFEYKHVKGITDEDLAKIKQEVEQIANNSIGTQMLYEIIQFIKEKMSSLGSIPKCTVCSICLDDLGQTNDRIINLECYHYYHEMCLLRHINYMEADIKKERQEAESNKLKWTPRDVSCPVCRNSLTKAETDYFHKLKQKTNLKHLDSKINVGFESFVISDKMRQMQNSMRIIYEKQKLAGGIIDDNKHEIIMIARNDNEQPDMAENNE